MTDVKATPENSICDTFSLAPLPTAPPSNDPPATPAQKAAAAALVEEFFGNVDWDAE